MSRGGLGAQIATSVGATGMLFALALANSALVARVGGPEARGLYQLALSVFAVGGAGLSLGLPAALVWAIGSGADPRALFGLQGALTASLCIVGGIGAAVALAAGGVPSTELGLVALGALVGLWGAVGWELGRGWLLGVGRVRAWNLVPLALLVLFFVANAVTLRWHPVAVLANFVAANAALGVGLLVVQWRAVGRPVWPGRALRSRVLGFGVRAALTRLSELGLKRLDGLLLIFLVPLADVGLFGVADQVGHIAAMPGLVIGQLLFARSSRDPTGRSTVRQLGVLVRVLLPLSALLAVGAVVALRWFIPLVFGAAFASSWVGVVYLAPAIVFRALDAQFATWLQGQGHQRALVQAGFVAAGLDVVLLLALVPSLGWAGAALAKAVAYAVRFLLTVRAWRTLVPDGLPGGWVLRREDVALVHARFRTLVGRR